MSAPEATLERLRAGLEGIDLREVEAADGMATLELGREQLPEVARRLRDGLGFDAPTLVTAVDLFPASPRFRVVLQLQSLAHNERVRLHVPLEEDDAALPSVTDVWPGVAYFERECFDMFGIRFDGHPDLRRLLMPEAYDHHPLRKDFPHQGIEPDRLYREWDRQRRETTGDAR